MLVTTKFPKSHLWLSYTHLISKALSHCTSFLHHHHTLSSPSLSYYLEQKKRRIEVQQFSSGKETSRKLVGL